MAIYTKKGDAGFTNLYKNKKRISKSTQIIASLGAIDEANSYLGTIKNKKLENIQKDLTVIGSIIAGAKIKFSEKRTAELEKEIDKLERKLPPLHGFLMPKGQLMYARALVRKAEREVVGLIQKSGISNQKSILAYLNRLSDYLFVLAREERE